MLKHQIIKKLAVSTSLGVIAASTMAQNEGLEGQQLENLLQLEEVVVTAQKRVQNLQDTPIAVSAFDKTAIEDQRINDINDIGASTPSVQISPTPGGTTGATVAIRGSTMVNPAVTWEPAVGIYFDGVFVAKNVGGLFDVAELERIEVLRGPQGTLYGKNTAGGAINLITRKPGEEFSGSAHVGMGTYGYTESGFSIDSGSLGGVAKLNIAYNKRDRDGFDDNKSKTAPAEKFSELDSESGRLSALFHIGDIVDLYLTSDWSEKNNTSPLGRREVESYTPPTGDALIGDYILPDPDRTDSGSLNGADFDHSESFGHALNVTVSINDALTFKSITAYRELEFNDKNDYDGTNVTFFHAERDVEQDQRSQELQLLGSFDAVSFVVGAFFFNEKAEAVNPFTFGILNPDFSNTVFPPTRNFYGAESTSTAIFGQADWMLTDGLTLTFGARYTEEKKEVYVSHPDNTDDFFAPDPWEVEAEDTWTNFSPLLVVSYAFTDSINTYFRAATGWSSGGFNAEASDAAEAEDPYDEQTIVSYELGMKARWFDSRFQTNVAVFQNTIEDMVLSEFLGAYSTVENAGEAEISGLELEMIASVIEGLTLSVNYGYLRGTYNEYTVSDGSGGEMDIKDEAVFPYLPEHKFSLGMEYVIDVNIAQLRMRLDSSYVDEQDFYDSKTSAQLTHSEDYIIHNARIAMTDIDIGNIMALEFGLWGKNLTDEEYRINGIPLVDANNTSQGAGLNYYGDPRTLGVDVRLSF